MRYSFRRIKNSVDYGYESKWGKVWRALAKEMDPFNEMRLRGLKAAGGDEKATDATWTKYFEATNPIRKKYSPALRAIEEEHHRAIMSQALNELNTVKQLLALIEWEQNSTGYTFPFEEWPEKCKHLYRLLVLDGKIK